jgi:hypothetical protein
VSEPTVIHCYNLSSIQLAKIPVFHARTKHIEVHYHFVRERVLSGEVELRYVPTDWQIAYIFTKPLGLDKLRHFSGVLGLHHLDVPNLRGRVEPEPEPELEPKPEPEPDRSEKAESDSGVDSDTMNQPRPRRIRRTQKNCQDRESKEAVKGRMGEDADQKGGRCRPEGSMPTKVGLCRPGWSMPTRVVDADRKGGRCHAEFRHVRKKPECQAVGTPKEKSGTKNSRRSDSSGKYRKVLENRRAGTSDPCGNTGSSTRAEDIRKPRHPKEGESEADAKSETG